MKIALAQINPTVADIDGNRKLILRSYESATDNGAHLVVFPELSITGYPPMDLLENPALIDRNLAALEALAQTTGETAAVVGYVDRDPEVPGMLANCAAFLRDGKIIARQAKTLLPSYDVFDEVRYFTPARDYTVIEHAGRKLGLTVCEDIWRDISSDDARYTEARSYDADPAGSLIEKGADIIINISASPFVRGKRRAREEMLSSIAEKHRVHLVYVNQVGGNDSLIFDGHSLLVAPDGTVTARTAGFTDDLLFADTSEEVSVPTDFNDLEEIRRALQLGIRDYMTKTGFRKALVGLSGGIDSALTATLAVEALGAENVRGITMPSHYSSEGSVTDSEKLAENLGIRIDTIAIGELFDTFRASLSDIFEGYKEDIAEENIQARIRGTLLMAASNKFGSLLLTTGNKSEIATGYCTLYGDMAGGLAVIADLPKTLVFELSRHINKDGEKIPEATITKAPSAELRPDQKDQDSLPPYEVLDAIIDRYIEDRASMDEIIADGFDAEVVDWVLRTINRNEYKRRQAAPGLKVTSKAFGSGRRIPLAMKFQP